MSEMDSCLLANIDKIHTTPLGAMRIKRNLGLADIDVVAWCKDGVRNSDSIVKNGKNYYVRAGDAVITVNSSSFTIITAHKVKQSVD